MRVKGYDKEQINLLAERYVKTKSSKVFEELLEACDPMIKIAVAKYGNIRHTEDMEQETRLRLWKNLQDPKRFKKYLYIIVPYLILTIRWYVNVSHQRLREIYREDTELGYPMKRDKMIPIIQNEIADPEFVYIFKNELPQELFKSCKERIMKSGLLAEDPEAVAKAVRLARQMIEDDFGGLLDDPK